MKLFIMPIAATLAVACAETAVGNQSSSEDYLPKNGLWEVQTILLSMDPPPGPDAKAIIDELGKPKIEKMCVKGILPKLGEIAFNPECRFSKISDNGHGVYREATCTENRMVIWRGTRSAESYDYQIQVRGTDPQTGQIMQSVKTQEQGRYIGAKC